LLLLLVQVARHMALLCLKDESVTSALRNRFRCVTIGAPLATLGRPWMAVMDALDVDVRKNFVSVLSATDAVRRHGAFVGTKDKHAAPCFVSCS
jgi:hypothetical protein